MWEGEKNGNLVTHLFFRRRETAQRHRDAKLSKVEEAIFVAVEQAERVGRDAGGEAGFGELRGEHLDESLLRELCGRDVGGCSGAVGGLGGDGVLGDGFVELAEEKFYFGVLPVVPGW